MVGTPRNRWRVIRYDHAFEEQAEQIEPDPLLRDDMFHAAELAAARHPDLPPCYPLGGNLRYVQLGPPGPLVDLLFTVDDENYCTFRAIRPAVVGQQPPQSSR
jgi:hypothetical protein